MVSAGSIGISTLDRAISSFPCSVYAKRAHANAVSDRFTDRRHARRDTVGYPDDML